MACGCYWVIKDTVDDHYRAWSREGPAGWTDDRAEAWRYRKSMDAFVDRRQFDPNVRVMRIRCAQHGGVR